MMNLSFYIYIPEYSKYSFKHAALNLITIKREFNLLQYSTTLSSIIASFCVIFDICYMMSLPFYIYSRILPVLITIFCIEFNQYKTRITVLQYSTALSSLITSFCVILDICYMMNLPFYIYIPVYSQYWYQHAALNLITTKRELLYYSILQHSQA